MTPAARQATSVPCLYRFVAFSIIDIGTYFRMLENLMTGTYQEQKMAHAMDAVDKKGNIVLQKNGEDALLFMPDARSSGRCSSR